jgi:hypothetical protein
MEPNTITQTTRAELLSRQFKMQSSAAALLLRAVNRLNLEFDHDAKQFVADARLWLFQHLYQNIDEEVPE